MTTQSKKVLGWGIFAMVVVAFVAYVIGNGNRAQTIINTPPIQAAPTPVPNDTATPIAIDVQTLSSTGQLTYATANCRIKGDISFNTKEKIYHVPGQRYYDATKIDPNYGERWFCTEQDAINNGWRKSKV